VTPNSLQSSLTTVCCWPIAVMARRSLAEVILYWPPPVRPRARADARPTLVRSDTSSRSNSARAAKMPNTSLPSGVAVLIDAPCPVSLFLNL